MKKKDRDKALAALTGAGSVAGGALGLKALDLVPASAKQKILEQLIQDHPIIISTLMAPELVTGSGEAKMARNIVTLLRNAGVNAKLGLSGGGEPMTEGIVKMLGADFFKKWIPYSSSPAYRDAFAQSWNKWWMPFQMLYPGSHINHKSLLDLNKYDTPTGKAGDSLLHKMIELSGPEGASWVKTTPVDRQKKIFNDLLSGKLKGLGIPGFDQALSKIRSGEWDKFSSGRLSTLLKLTNNLDPVLKDGAGMYLTPGEMSSRIESGRAAGFMGTERGFPWSAPATVSESRSGYSYIMKLLEQTKLDPETKDAIATRLLRYKYGLSSADETRLKRVLKGDILGEMTGDGINPMFDASRKQLLSESIGPNKGVKNLGLLYNFKANYNNPGDNWIPGADVRMPKEKIEDVLKDRAISRANMLKALNGIRAEDGLKGISPNTRMIFMSGGSVGPNGTQKLMDVLKATEGMDNVHVFSQIGGDKDYLNMIQNNAAHRKTLKSQKDVAKYLADTHGKGGYISDLEREYAALAKKYPGKFTLVSRLPSETIRDAIAGSDLYIPYGGSSTAQEATGFLTPQAFSTDDALNKGNIDFIRGKRNAPELMGELDNTSTGLARHLSYDPKAAKAFSMTSGLNGSYRQKLTDAFRLGLFGNEKSVADVIAAADKANASNTATIRRLLSDDVQRQAFSQSNLNRVRRLVQSQQDATSRFVAAAKRIAANAVSRTDKGLRFGIGPRGVANGLKGLYLRLGRTLAHGPVGSRLAPAALGLGLLGGGAGAYFAGKKSFED